MTGTVIGRHAEEAGLRGLVRDVAAGQGQSILVEGEPGIGKSSLLSAGLAEATTLGCRLLSGAADEFGGRFPLRVLLDCFANAGTRVDWENADSGSYDPVLATMERLLETVGRLCADRADHRRSAVGR